MANITYKKTGSIFEEDAKALVNTVNCAGFMGKGIALDFKRAFKRVCPMYFKEYESLCKNREMRPGRVFVFETGSACNPLYIINFPTKLHWRGKSRMEYIQDGLASLVEEIRKRDIRSIALPALGCGLGGLNWDEVRQQIEDAMGKLDNVQVTVFEPRPREQEATGADPQPEP